MADLPEAEEIAPGKPTTAPKAFESKQLLPDEEIRKLGIAESDIELYRRLHYQASFALDSWLEPLKEHSFRTEFVDLTYLEGQALSKAPNRRDAKDLAQLEGLQTRLDKVILQFPAGAFVKLNTRSPKDVPVYAVEDPNLQAMVSKEFEAKGANRTDTDEVWAFVMATNKSMCVKNGKEAVELLSKSTRIREDLSKILNFPEKLFKASVSIREWLEEVADRPWMEFRAFVNRGKLNAMTQYFCFAYAPELHHTKDKVAKQVLYFFETVKDRIKLDAYVIDFYVKKDGGVMIIELNPFHIGAGPGLFTWATDRDLFLSGPFQFRIVESPPTDTWDIIPLVWQKWLNRKYHPERLQAPPAAATAKNAEEEQIHPQTGSWWGSCSIL